MRCVGRPYGSASNSSSVTGHVVGSGGRLAVYRFRQSVHGAAVYPGDVDPGDVDALAHRRAEATGGIAAEPPGFGTPTWRSDQSRMSAP